jgi:hypothetical protein
MHVRNKQLLFRFRLKIAILFLYGLRISSSLSLSLALFIKRAAEAMERTRCFLEHTPGHGTGTGLHDRQEHGRRDCQHRKRKVTAKAEAFEKVEKGTFSAGVHGKYSLEADLWKLRRR